MKYRVEFIKENKIEILKEFKEYDEAYDYSNSATRFVMKSYDMLKVA